MELRSGRRLRRSSPPPPSHPHGTSSQRTDDLISALPDEMLLLVLARLRCARTAAQTSLLSRRWRDLWCGLWIGPTDLTFRRLTPSRIEALFLRFAASLQVSTLDIVLPRIYSITGASSLLRAATRLSPEHLVFTLPEPYTGYMVELPCFERTTSIDIDISDNCSLTLLPAGEFNALDSLSVTGEVMDLGLLLSRCPRLRVLSLTYPKKFRLRMPDGEYPALETLSLTGRIVGPDSTHVSLASCCHRLRALSITQLDTYPLRIVLPPSEEFLMLEKLTISGNTLRKSIKLEAL